MVWIQFLWKHKEALIKLITDNDDLIYCTTIINIHIDTGDHKPVALKSYRIPLAHIKWLDEQTGKLLKSEIIKHSTSPWSSLVALVSKMEDGLCTDFRKLNFFTTQYKFPMPFIHKILLSLGKFEHFSSLDLRWGYHQMTLDDKTIHKTTFISAKGKYKFLKVPFGLVQAPARFQEMVKRVLKYYPL